MWSALCAPFNNRGKAPYERHNNYSLLTTNYSLPLKGFRVTQKINSLFFLSSVILLTGLIFCGINNYINVYNHKSSVSPGALYDAFIIGKNNAHFTLKNNLAGGISGKDSGFTIFFNETFSNGSSGWTVLSGSVEVYEDKADISDSNTLTQKTKHVLLFNSENSRVLANTFKPVPQNEKITLNFKVKSADSGKNSGIYLVDDKGVGYGFLITNGEGNTVTLKLEKTENFAETAKTAASFPAESYSTGDWHAVSVLWNTEEHTFEFYVNGTHVDTVSDAEYPSFSKIVAFGSAGVSLANIKINSTPETIIHVMGWYSPIGYLVGKQYWGEYGYKYERYANPSLLSEYPKPLDYPLPPEGVVLPETAPTIGNDDYYALQYQAALHSELPKMKEAGYSAVVIDMACNPEYDPAAKLDFKNTPSSHYKTFLTWLEAAKKIGGIKIGMYLERVGMSGDFLEGWPRGTFVYDKEGQKKYTYDMTTEQWEMTLGACIENVIDDGALWKVDGKTAFMMFANSVNLNLGTAVPHGWDKIIDNLRKTKDFYFIADVNPNEDGSEYGKWSETADAAYFFNPSAPKEWFNGTARTQQIGMFTTFTTQTAYSQKPFYFISSRGYYSNGGTGYKYALPDFARIHNAYEAAIAANAPGILTATWNDFAEETHIVPSARNGSAILDIYAYYNTWLRTGVKPSAAKENVTICYPVNIPNTINVVPTGTGLEFWQSASHDKGRVYYWANLQTPHTLKVNDSETVTLPAGLSFDEIPGGIAAGEVTAYLTPENGTTEQFILTPIQVINQAPEDGGLGFQYKRLNKKQSPHQPVNAFDNVKYYPNPIHPSKGPNYAKMNFANIPAGTRIKIYTLLGQLVRDLEADASGTAVWDGKNNAGEKAASGVYIVYMEDGNGNKKRIKIAVER